MTERERQRNRLIEILKHDLCDEQPREEGESGCKSCPYHHLMTETTTCFEARYADLLLREGVSVPPCNVGDTVYTIVKTYSPCRLGCSWDEIRCDGCEAECDSHATLSIGEETVTAFRYDGKWSVFTNKSHMFAKTIGEPRYGVLLTKEDAEKALAERSEGK